MTKPKAKKRPLGERAPEDAFLASRARSRVEAEATFPVAHDIPLPPRLQAGGRPKGTKAIFHPWHLMKVGSSFIVPCEPGDAATVQCRLNTLSRQQRLRHGGKYETRMVQGGVRIWRTK